MWKAVAPARSNRLIIGSSGPSGPLERPLRRLDVHAFDHLVLEALGAAGESVDEPARSLDLSFAGPKAAVARLDLVGMDQDFAVEAQLPPFAAPRRRSLRDRSAG